MPPAHPKSMASRPVTSRPPRAAESCCRVSCRVSVSSLSLQRSFLNELKGGSLRSPPAPAAGGRKRSSSPALMAWSGRRPSEIAPGAQLVDAASIVALPE
jgi:hypothetical protein